MVAWMQRKTTQHADDLAGCLPYRPTVLIFLKRSRDGTPRSDKLSLKICRLERGISLLIGYLVPSFHQAAQIVQNIVNAGNFAHFLKRAYVLDYR